MQPQKEKKIKGLTLLERLKLKYGVELGMTYTSGTRKYQLDSTKDKIILVSYKGDFIGSARDMKDVVAMIAETEKTTIINFDESNLVANYVPEIEKIDTKMYEEKMPKALTKSNGIKMYGKRFYIVKKKPDGSSSGSIFCLYNFDTRNLLWANHDRDLLIGFLMTKYKTIENKDI